MRSQSSNPLRALRSLGFLGFFILLGAALLLAQTKQTTPPQKSDVAKAAPTVALTEVEQLKLENLTLKASLLSQQQQQLQQQYGALVAEIQKAHPGYVLSPAGTLVPAPKPAQK